MTDDEPTVYDLHASTQEGAVGLAAAGLANEVLSLIHAAHRSSGLTSAELAERVGVSPGRISQILNGDGNMRMSTAAKLLRACGYQLGLVADPVEKGRSSISLPRRRRRRMNDKVRQPRTPNSWAQSQDGPMTEVLTRRIDIQLEAVTPRPVRWTTESSVEVVAERPRRRRSAR